MKILVVEDDIDIRSLLQVAVESLGHQAIVAPDGDEGWRLYESGGADAIVSDWRMPGLLGPDLCKRVRDHPGPYVYFVLLTAMDSEESMLDGMKAGADDYLTKPFTIGALRARLVAAERVSRLHRELARRDAERAESLARRESILRVARGLAAEVDPSHLLAELIVEAVSLVGGTSGVVFRWDDAQSLLIPVAHTADAPVTEPLRLGEGVAGRAAAQRLPAFQGGDGAEFEGAGEVSADPQDARSQGAGGDDAVCGSLAIPLVNEGRLLGSLLVIRDRADGTVIDDDVASLELLAGIATASLVSLERAQLEAVNLAARELAHVLNNDLALPVGAFELLTDDPDLPSHLREIVEGSSSGLNSAVEHVRRLQQIVRVARKDTPVGPSLDLDRSVLDASA